MIWVEDSDTAMHHWQLYKKKSKFVQFHQGVFQKKQLVPKVSQNLVSSWDTLHFVENLTTFNHK